MTRPAIVDLRDLTHRYMWDARAIEAFVDATGLSVEPEPAWRDLHPPRVLVVIAAFDHPAYFTGTRPWFAECDHVVVVRDRRGNSNVTEPELIDGYRDDWTRVLASLPATIFDWTDGDASGCRAAIDHALARCAALPARSPRVTPAPLDLDLPLSQWVPYTRRETYPTTREVLAAQLAFEDGHAVLVDASGTPHDLAHLRGPIELARTDVALRGRTLAGASEDTRNNHRWPINVDPIHPLAWRGHRMSAYAFYATATELGFLTALDHDYPTGPGKKLWGYEDNDPVAVAVTPSADAAALVFGHDVTVINNVPIGWHRAGAVDVARFAGDPDRAVFYANETDWIAAHDPVDEDAREIAPELVLGPSRDVRYAVDLRMRTHRVTGPNRGAVATDLGLGGYLVCSATHEVVRRGTGHLLGGWYRYATVEDDGALWREDLATGARILLGSAARVTCEPDVVDIVQDAIRERRDDAIASLRTRGLVRDVEPSSAVAIPGTRNMLEYTETLLRVI